MIDAVYIVKPDELDKILDSIDEYNINNGIVFSESEWLCNMITNHFPKICRENIFDDTIIEAFLKYQNNTDQSEMGVIILDNYIDDERVNWLIENLESYNILLIMTME